MFLKSIVQLLMLACVVIFLSSPALAVETIYMSLKPLSQNVTTSEIIDQGAVKNTKRVTVSNFDYGNPTPAEQLHLELLNRARMDPTGEAARLGIDLFEGVDEGDITGLPAQPLTLNSLLNQAAKTHSEDMIINDYFSHYSPDGSSPFDRMRRSGYTYNTAGENIAFKGSTGYLVEADVSVDLHNNLFIDVDYPHRGHRVSILNPAFKEVGIGLAYGAYSTGGTTYDNSFMVTCDFGASALFPGPFILGVVYDDEDNDGFYDVGEGTGAVTLKVVEAGTFTTSASAGGYAVPVDSGTYTVEATLEDGRKAQKEISVSSENVKLDFTLAEFGSVQATSCSTIDGDLNISIPCAVYYDPSTTLSLTAEFKYQGLNKNNEMAWALTGASLISESSPSCAIIAPDLTITIDCAMLGELSLWLALTPSDDGLWVLSGVRVNE